MLVVIAVFKLLDIIYRFRLKPHGVSANGPLSFFRLKNKYEEFVPLPLLETASLNSGTRGCPPPSTVSRST